MFWKPSSTPSWELSWSYSEKVLPGADQIDFRVRSLNVEMEKSIKIFALVPTYKNHYFLKFVYFFVCLSSRWDKSCAFHWNLAFLNTFTEEDEYW